MAKALARIVNDFLKKGEREAIPLDMVGSEGVNQNVDDATYAGGAACPMRKD